MTWIDELKKIKEVVTHDFEHADVRGFVFKLIAGKVHCEVTVLNADGRLVTWELVDDGVSAECWREVTNVVH